jgi:hypothetical protein
VALLDACLHGSLDVLNGELVDRSAEDRLDARQPDGHRDSVCNREPRPTGERQFASKVEAAQSQQRQVMTLSRSRDEDQQL